jgi:hypothetical protein
MLARRTSSRFLHSGWRTWPCSAALHTPIKSFRVFRLIHTAHPETAGLIAKGSDYCGQIERISLRTADEARRIALNMAKLRPATRRGRLRGRRVPSMELIPVEWSYLGTGPKFSACTQGGGERHAISRLSVQLFNFQWVAQPAARSLLLLFTDGSRR